MFANIRSLSEKKAFSDWPTKLAGCCHGRVSLDDVNRELAIELVNRWVICVANHHSAACSFKPSGHSCEPFLVRPRKDLRVVFDEAIVLMRDRIRGSKYTKSPFWAAVVAA